MRRGMLAFLPDGSCLRCALTPLPFLYPDPLARIATRGYDGGMNRIAHDLDDFLIKLLDAAPADLFAIDIDDARAILDSLPDDSRIRESLRDAFRDNIDCDDSIF